MPEIPFTGEYECTLDDRGRLVIPSAFCKILKAMEVGELYITLQTKRLVICLPDKFKELGEEIKRETDVPREERDRKLHRWYGKARRINPDKDGRILIPPRLRTQAFLDREVMVVGMCDVIEIWNRKEWEEYC
jgi:MraZ protein